MSTQTLLTDDEKKALEASVKDQLRKDNPNWDDKTFNMQAPRKVKSAIEEAEARKAVLAETPSLEGKALDNAIKKRVKINKAEADVATAQKSLTDSVEKLVKARMVLENASKGKSSGGGIPKEKLEKLLESA